MVPEARRKVAANYAEERYTSKSNPVKARIQSETWGKLIPQIESRSPPGFGWGDNHVVRDHAATIWRLDSIGKFLSLISNG